MEKTRLDRRSRGVLRSAIVCLLGYSLVTCASPVSPVPKTNAPGEVHIAKQQTVRTIIYFQHPTVDNKALSVAISEGCRCLPVFIRAYRSDALIYEIALPQGQSFALFEKALMQNAVQLGIKIVEQDRVMHIE